MKTQYFIVLVLFFGFLLGACSGEAKKESDAKNKSESVKVNGADTSRAAKMAKRGQDLEEQANHLATIYCSCTERRADTTRRACMERIEKAVTAISTNLKGDEKTAFDTRYNGKTATCKAKGAK